MNVVALAKQLALKQQQSPVDYIAWLPTQLEFLKHTNHRMPYLFRAGNRQGKTTVGAAEVIFRARKHHPFKALPTINGPVKIAVVCMSLLQSIPIQEMVWNLIDKKLVKPGTEFNPKTGFGAHTPMLELTNGSIIRFYGGAQGAGALAGAEFHFILLDEPPDQTIYDECIKRVANTGGNVALTLTPINGPPLPWLRQFCEEGIVCDYHMKLTPESQISPLTGKVRLTKDGQPWDASFIEHITKLTSPIDAPIRLHGEWQSKMVGQFFKEFDKNKHIVAHLPDGDFKLGLGIDYASADREHGLCSVLLGWLTNSDGSTTIYAIDEVALHGSTNMAGFAEAIIKMLAHHNVKWSELDYVWGDNPVVSGSSISSNIELTKALQKALGTKNLRPGIRNVKEGGGASHKNRRTKDIRCRWLFSEISSDRFYISSRCKWLAEALQMWDYDDSSEYKDILDACMYGLKVLWTESHTWTPVRLNIV